MVDTDQISTSADEPGLVIRNEDVFIAKVRERVALAETLGHLLSPVLLMATGQAGAAAGRAGRRRRRLGEPQVARCRPGRPYPRDLAGAGRLAARRAAGPRRRRRARRRRRQPPQPGRADRRIPAVPGGRHHARLGGDPAVQPAGHAPPASTPAEAGRAARTRRARWSRRIAAPPQLPTHERDHPPVRRRPSLGGHGCPRDPAASDVDNLDHALVERVLLGHALGMDAGRQADRLRRRRLRRGLAGRRGRRRPGRSRHPDRPGDGRRFRRGQPESREASAQEHLVHPEGARRLSVGRASSHASSWLWKTARYARLCGIRPCRLRAQDAPGGRVDQGRVTTSSTSARRPTTPRTTTRRTASSPAPRWSRIRAASAW